MVKVKQELLQKIDEKLQGIQYGTLVITVHNDEITQLDITKKLRFEPPQTTSKKNQQKFKNII